MKHYQQNGCHLFTAAQNRMLSDMIAHVFKLFAELNGN